MSEGERQASRTAIGVAMLRAAHQVLDGGPKVLDDTVIVSLLGPALMDRVRGEAERFDIPRSLALRAHVLLRSRFTEERLRLAVERGVTQLIVLGAGLDTFSLRQPDWARTLRIYEVDHPASQSVKRGMIGRAEIPMPHNVTFVPIDFEHDTLQDGLARAGFDPAAMTFVSCLGVLVYLTRAAIDELFAFIARLPAGSECAFTFGGKQDEERPNETSLAAMAAHAGEPWISTMEIDDVRAMLVRAGLPGPEQPSPEQILGWLGDRTDQLRPPKRNAIASVVVGGPLTLTSTS